MKILHWNRKSGKPAPENRLEEIRSMAGLSQRQIADELHVPEKTVGNWEKRKDVPTLINAYNLSRLLGADINEIFPYNSEPEEEKLIIENSTANTEAYVRVQQIIDAVFGEHLTITRK